MGSKGSAQTVQQYTPNPAVVGAGTQAIGMAEQAAAQPFQQPVQPIAGFTPQQLQAFGQVGNYSNAASPYIQAGANLMAAGATPNVSQYFGNAVAGVLPQLQNIFGQQMSQTTGNLQQAAGGVGADRIAIGQSELANQQGLAADQTLSGLYSNAVNQALSGAQLQQGAGYGLGALGGQLQGLGLQGAQALYGAGAAQQGQTQAELNAQYQNRLAQLAYPFQTAQYLAGIAGGLGGAMGGTTTTTPPTPSLLSQVLGAGAAGVGMLGQTGAFGPSGYLTGGQGLFPGGLFSGNTPWTGSYVTGGFGPNAAYTAKRGGRVNPYQLGGGTMLGTDPFGQEGGPSIVPDLHLAMTQPQRPTVTPSQSGSGSNTGSALGTIGSLAMQILPMFAAEGGAVNPYNAFEAFADGGLTAADFNARWSGSDPNMAPPYNLPVNPTQGGIPIDPYVPLDAIRQGYAPEFAAAVQALRGAPAADAAATQAWRSDAMNPLAAGSPAPQLPPAQMVSAAPSIADVNAAALPPTSQPTIGQVPPGIISQATDQESQLARSPWAALTAAGLGMMAGTSPYPLVNIGRGGLEGVRTLEQQRTAAQADTRIDLEARKLEQEAQHWRDQYEKMTPYQAAELGLRQKQFELTAMQPVKIGSDLFGDIYAQKDPKTGLYHRIDPRTGQMSPSGSATPEGVTGTPPASVAPVAPGASAALPPTSQPTQGPVSPEITALATNGITPNDWTRDVPPAGTITHPANRNEQMLASLPPDQQALVRNIADYKINPATLSYRDRTRILSTVALYDPTYDMSQFKTRNQAMSNFTGSGVEARNFTSNDMAIQHIGSALDNANNLGNTNIPVANWLRKAGLSQYDPAYQAALRTFQIDVDAIGNELMRSFRGSGSPSEKEALEWRSKLNDTDSPAAIRASLKEAATLLGSRVAAAGNRYNDAMGPMYARDPMSWLSRKGQSTFERALTLDPQTGRPMGQQAPAAAGPQTAAAIPPANEREAGKVYQTPKGPFRWTGSGWQAVQ